MINRQYFQAEVINDEPDTKKHNKLKSSSTIRITNKYITYNKLYK